MHTLYHSIKKIIVFVPLILWSCFGDAPRNNPLDPENPNSTVADLSGRVLTNRVPHQPISNIKVTWQNNRFDYSDEKGYFNFMDVNKENGWLVFESENYLTDSAFVNWSGLTPNLEKFLNASPLLQSITLYSSIKNGYPDRQDISLNFLAEISDPDNDIDSVLLKSETLKVNTFLEYDFEQKNYQKSLTMADLNIGSPESVIGQEFLISVKDNFNNLIPLTTEVVKRIIKDEVILSTLDEGDTLSVTPTLKWELINPGFPFEYMVEIYIDEIDPRLVYRKENIASTITSLTLETSLAENRYFWIVWVIDEFENRSASKPKSFYAR